MAGRTRSTSARPRGTTVLEITIALALLGAAASVFAQLHLAAARQQRSAEKRAAAHQTLANWMELSSQVPFADVAPENLTKLAPLDPLQLHMPSVEPVAEVFDETGEPSGKRVTLELRWPAADGVSQESVQLTAWRYEADATISVDDEASP